MTSKASTEVAHCEETDWTNKGGNGRKVSGRGDVQILRNFGYRVEHVERRSQQSQFDGIMHGRSLTEAPRAIFGSYHGRKGRQKDCDYCGGLAEAEEPGFITDAPWPGLAAA